MVGFFLVFNVILLLSVNHLQDFYCDWQTTWRLVLHPWNHGRTNDLSLDIFNNDSNHPRMCVLSTFCGNVDKHSPFDIYIYIYIYRDCMYIPSGSVTEAKHSVESPSMVDPQWNIWYWGSKWNWHTVCLSAVGCEWGTTSVYFGITYVCFIPSRLPVFAVEPQYLLQYFLFLSKVSFELHIQNLQKISCWFKIWMGFVGPILIKLWTSSIWGFL